MAHRNKNSGIIDSVYLRTYKTGPLQFRLIGLPLALVISGLTLALMLGFAVSGSAHAPQRHSFKLTSFRRPLTAPEIMVGTPSGETITLSEFRGKVVLLNFWATWCPPCLKEMPSMEQLYNSYKDQGFVVLAISIDEEGLPKVSPFLERLKLTFPIGLDPKSRVARIYGANDLPSSFIINRKGKVIAAAKGERDWFSAEARSYLEEVIAQEKS